MTIDPRIAIHDVNGGDVVVQNLKKKAPPESLSKMVQAVGTGLRPLRARCRRPIRPGPVSWRLEWDWGDSNRNPSVAG